MAKNRKGLKISKSQNGNHTVEFGQEDNSHFTPQELKEYNELYPDFAVGYLKNIIEIPNKLVDLEDTSAKTRKFAILVSLGVIVFFMSVTIFLLICQQFQLATTIMVAGIVVLVVAMLKGRKEDTASK